jgi:GNAT superfamily N-acetyltransferase
LASSTTPRFSSSGGRPACTFAPRAATLWPPSRARWLPACRPLSGCATATHDSRKGWINRLAVHPAHRRRVLALRLVRLCGQHFQAQGIDVWAALIEDWNAPSLALFRQAGYDLAPNITYASRRMGAGV